MRQTLNQHHPIFSSSFRYCCSRMSSIRFTLLALFLSLSTVAGCGGSPDGPQRYALTGTVTREGKPLAEGTIRMAPAGGGPAGEINILEGAYEYSEENGPVEGEQTVTILRFLKKGPIPPGGVPKDADYIPETGFESPMPEGGWVMKVTISSDQDVSEPVDFNVDEAPKPERGGRRR